MRIWTPEVTEYFQFYLVIRVFFLPECDEKVSEGFEKKHEVIYILKRSCLPLLKAQMMGGREIGVLEFSNWHLTVTWTRTGGEVTVKSHAIGHIFEGVPAALSEWMSESTKEISFKNDRPLSLWTKHFDKWHVICWV